MIQNGTFLKVVDNSGAKIAFCIKVKAGPNRKYAYMRDSVFVSIKELRSKRRLTSKVKKGATLKALILHTRSKFKTLVGETFNFFSNNAVLLNRQNKLVGSRILSAVPKKFRFTKFLKLASLSFGFID
jgi:large subunit ribosomal protein L14